MGRGRASRISKVRPMRLAPALLAALAASPALAHPGHLAETAGHTHWLALGAAGAALCVTAAALGRRVARRRRDAAAKTL
jgi:hypothetical protein